MNRYQLQLLEQSLEQMIDDEVLLSQEWSLEPWRRCLGQVRYLILMNQAGWQSCSRRILTDECE